MVKVSIIVPVYNVEKYIDKCLNSLVNQTLQEIEIIIVDDGSIDNSKKIIKKYKEEYPQKIISLKKENGGLSDARNFGMEYAKGEYIGCVDSDDYIDVTMYEKMYNKAKEENSDMVECNFYWKYQKKLKEDIGTIYTIENMLVQARVVAWNKIIKSEIIKQNNIKYPVGLRYEDIEFFCKIAPFIKSVSFIAEPLVYYIQRENSISNTQNEKTKDIFAILDNIIKYYKYYNLYEKYKTELEYNYLRLLLGSSFLRIVKIKNKEIRKRLLKQTMENLNNNFPNWKQNEILQKSKSQKDLYYKTINTYTFKIYSVLFRMVKK